MPTPNVGLTQPAQGTAPWDAIVNGNMTIIDNCFGGTVVVPAIAPTNIKPNNVTTILAGVPALVAKADLTAQAANVGSTLLYAVPSTGAGMYRVSFYLVVTQAATVSSTLPNGEISFTDNDTGIAGLGPYIITGTNTGNQVGASNSVPALPAAESAILNCKASTNINYLTANYASSGATPMQYAIHVKLEYLGL